MKAIRVHEFGGPEVLKYEETPTPKPDTGEVLLRVQAAGVNPYDTYMRNGTYAIKPPLPYTPGSDAAGVIEGAIPGDVVRYCTFDNALRAEIKDTAGIGAGSIALISSNDTAGYRQCAAIDNSAAGDRIRIDPAVASGNSKSTNIDGLISDIKN